MTDIPRLRAGQVGGQFWSVWISPSVTGPAAIKMTLEQIDIVKSMAARWPKDFEMAYTADDIVRAHKAGRVASLIGIEGGHQIDNSLAMLRQMYAAGARYMTLTHALNNDWADSATDTPKHHGLTAFGKAVVHEMNRAGMLVDLSHVSPETMKAALEVSQAPVMFSHSGARALDDHPRDVPDDVLAHGREEPRRGHGEFRAAIRVGRTREMGIRSRRRKDALQRAAVRRLLHRPARARQEGARGVGRETSASGSDDRDGGRSHRAHPQSLPASTASASARISTAFRPRRKVSTASTSIPLLLQRTRAARLERTTNSRKSPAATSCA